MKLTANLFIFILTFIVAFARADISVINTKTVRSYLELSQCKNGWMSSTPLVMNAKIAAHVAVGSIITSVQLVNYKNKSVNCQPTAIHCESATYDSIVNFRTKDGLDTNVYVKDCMLIKAIL